RSKSFAPAIWGGMTWVSAGFSFGPPATWMRFARFSAYEIACRTWTFFSAPLLFGDTVLNSTYGLLAMLLSTLSVGSFALSSWTASVELGPASNDRSADGLLVRSCWVIESWLPVSLIEILSTYALRSESVLASHAGLRVSTNVCAGLYDCTW